MSAESTWIIGSVRSGKTTRLMQKFQANLEAVQDQCQPAIVPPILVFAANSDNRIVLAERLVEAIAGTYPIQTTTPLGFTIDEVLLFWPLLIESLDLRAQFPMRLRPETEQELATQLWHLALTQGGLQQEGVSEYRMVRRTLDLYALSSAAGVLPEQIAELLETGFAETQGSPALWRAMGEAILEWRQWCLERGFLSYGLVSELYWRHLLPNPRYQQHLLKRYRFVCADDVDEYPAIALFLFEFLLKAGVGGCFTYNPNGGIRLGLGADPKYLSSLARYCQIEALSEQPTCGLAADWGETCVNRVLQPLWSEPVSLSAPEIQVLSTPSRSQLLRQTAETIINAVERAEAAPQEIAIITPGLDAIARYTLSEILGKAGIETTLLNDQRPLNQSPPIRALLSLLALVYPGNGRLLNRDAIAEMLVILSSAPNPEQPTLYTPDIDPVRAGLLADHCYAPSPTQPRLLPPHTFPRWDRLGHRATTAYQHLQEWIEQQQEQLQNRLLPTPLVLLDRAIQRFLWSGTHLSYEQLANLRELVETAQHYWEVQNRLPKTPDSRSNPIGQFIELLRRGTVSANPYPVRSLRSPQQSVTLATIFQYRLSRMSHRWHFWLDAGSPLWLKGGAAVLFGAPLFLQDRLNKPWTEADTAQADEERLKRILLDLLSRTEERLFLCHSDLATNGQEQTGPLLSLVNSAVPLSSEPQSPVFTL
ncbi:MAG: recombinase family protein [Desertifilum sp.]|nr:recombinase family protein [Desertifilum sp.]